MKKLKDIIKKNPVANATFGTDPSNPWATKYNVTEATETELLARYLNSRGVNPRFVTRDTKIAHAKSSEYAKWKADHIERFAREEVEVKEDHVAIAMGKQLDDEGSMILNQLDQITRCVNMLKPVIKKPDMQVPAWVQSKVTLATDYIDTVANYMTSNNEKVSEGYDDHKQIAKELVKRHGKNVTKQHIKDIEGERDSRGSLDHDEVMAHVKKLNEAKKPTALEKFRKAAAEREKKHAEIEKKQSKDGSGMTSAIDRLEKHLNKEEVINEISSSEVEHHFNNWSNSEHAPYNSDAGDDNKVHQSALRYLRSTNVPKEKHEKLAMHIAHKFHGSGIDEEVEQIDELKKSTVFSWLKQQPVVPEKKPGMSRKDHNKKIKTSSKSWNRALDRLAGYKPTSEAAGISKTKETSFHKKLDTLVHHTFGKRKDELKMKEDTFQDSQAATQMPFDGANTTNDTDMKRREATKSARIIKSIYKRKNMKEELNDWEKEDKSVQSYGKKPKLDVTDKKSNIGENKPEARAVMTGGKTLTGQPRDMVEIDPSMKNRPDRPDTFDKGNPKKSPA